MSDPRVRIPARHGAGGARRHPLSAAACLLLLLATPAVLGAAPSCDARRAAVGDTLCAAALTRLAPVLDVAGNPVDYAVVDRAGSHLSHTTPAYRSLNEARAVTLAYSSTRAAPIGFVQVDATDASTEAPSGMSIRVKDAAGTWVTAETFFQAGSGANRLAASWPAAGGATSVSSYTVVVRTYWADGGYAESSASVRVPIVTDQYNALYGHLGVGWIIAGQQRIGIQADGVMWLMEGDGTLQSFGTAGAGGVYTGPAGDFTTLQWVASEPGYVRRYPDGGKVVFDAGGAMTAQVDRAGNRTTWSYDSGGRLLAITDPVGKAFTFGYGDASAGYGAGRLASITDPGQRVTRFYYNAYGDVYAIQDSDQVMALTLNYFGDTHRVSEWWDRAMAQRSPGYDHNGLLASTLAPMVQVDGQNVRPQVQVASWVSAVLPQQGTGTSLATASPRVVPANVRMQLTDPRGYTTKLAVDAGGRPTRLEDALGNVTVIERDPRFPTRVTKVDAPGGGAVNGSVPGVGPRKVSLAWYNTLGGVDSVRQVDPLDDGYSPVTRYAYGDASWPYFATSVTSPTGIVESTGYDAATGNRAWQQVGADTMRRVRFGYNARGQVDTVRSAAARARGEAPEVIEYDTLGNLSVVQSPKGFRTRYESDALGQVTVIRTPIDSAQAAWQVQTVAYDLMGRDTLTRSYGPTMSSRFGPQSVADTLIVRKAYDLAGNLIALRQRSKPDQNDIGTILTRWRYDALRRTIAEVAPPSAIDTAVVLHHQTICTTPQPEDCHVSEYETTEISGGPEIKDSTVYDPAGNVVEVHTRRGHTITMTYDALGRLKTRSVPQAQAATFALTGGWTLPLQPVTMGAETYQFTYDASGALLTGNNSAAQVSRAYFSGGALKAETERVREYSGTAYSHVYTVSYRYDREGRRSAMHVPGPVAPAGGDSVRYAYHASTGSLETVTDPLGNAFVSHYDDDQRLTGLDMPGGIAETRMYDADGRLRTRTETVSNAYVLGQSTAYGAWKTGSVHTDGMRYNARGQVDSATYITGEVTLSAQKTAQLYSYSGLGPLLAFEFLPGAVQGLGSASYVQTDAFGNRYWSEEDASATADPAVRVYYYEARSGRMLRYTPTGSVTLDGTATYVDTQDNTYDAAGNRVTTLQNYTCMGANTAEGCGAKKSAMAFYYDAENRLREVHRRSCVVQQNGTCDYSQPLARDHKSGVEEHRYDALGRRVLVRFSSHTSCSAACPNFIQRTLWDGDQILAEIRAPGGASDAAQYENDSPTGSSAANNLYGRVLYTHGAGIDHPFDIIRMGFNGYQTPMVVIPHSNGKGQYDIGSDPQGRSLGNKACVDASVSASCGYLEWPGSTNDEFFRSRTNDATLPPWLGSLQNEGRDQSGQLYKRNRYYDPQSGQFTQEDPIGLAGGVNLYGFAGGDPVNYADPYGLCPPADKDVTTCENTAIGTAWRALDAAGAEGHATIDAVVDGSYSVQLVSGVNSKCTESLRGCTLKDERIIYLEASDPAGGLAVTLAHEAGGHVTERSAITATQQADNEMRAWDISMKVYNRMSGRLKREARDTHVDVNGNSLIFFYNADRPAMRQQQIDIYRGKCYRQMGQRSPSCQ